MKEVVYCGLIIAVVGAMALIASSSTSLKGDKEYTYKAGIGMSSIGLLLTFIGLVSVLWL